MGNFYVNITTRKAATDDLMDYLRSKDLNAFLIKGPLDYCTIYEERCDEQDVPHVSSMLEEISRNFSCPALGVLNHDDSVLAYELWSGGNKVDEYVSCPGYFEGDEDLVEPQGGNPRLLAELMGNAADEKILESVLRSSGSGEGGFTFELDRHKALAEALGLPIHSVGYGFQYLSEGELPEGLQPEDILSTDGE